RRRHERAEDPQDREEDPEEEQPPMPVPDRHHTKRDHQHQVQDSGADTDSPPHESSFFERVPPTLTRRRHGTSPTPGDGGTRGVGAHPVPPGWGGCAPPVT